MSNTVRSTTKHTCSAYYRMLPARRRTVLTSAVVALHLDSSCTTFGRTGHDPRSNDSCNSLAAASGEVKDLHENTSPRFAIDIYYFSSYIITMKRLYYNIFGAFQRRITGLDIPSGKGFFAFPWYTLSFSTVPLAGVAWRTTFCT